MEPVKFDGKGSDGAALTVTDTDTTAISRYVEQADSGGGKYPNDEEEMFALETSNQLWPVTAEEDPE